MYFSVFYGVLDPLAGRLSYASAGHPYAFRVPRFGDPERLEATAPPLGLATAGSIQRRQVPWGVGHDLLVLWTDGLVDARNEQGEPFGEQRILAEVGAHRDESPEAIVQAVLATAEAFGVAAERRPHAPGAPDLRCRGPSAASASTSSPIRGSSTRIADAVGATAADTVLEIGPGPRRPDRGARREGGAGGGHREGRAISCPRSRTGCPRRGGGPGRRARGRLARARRRRFPRRRQHPLQHHLAADRQGAGAAAAAADRVPGAEGGRRPSGCGAGRREAYGALSVGVQAVARAERLFTVPAGAFTPRPKVDSAVLRLTPLAEPLVRGRGGGAVPPAGGRAVRVPAQADAAGTAGADGMGRCAGGRRARAGGHRPADASGGRRPAAVRPACSGRSLTGDGRRGNFVKCFTKMRVMR